MKRSITTLLVLALGVSVVGAACGDDDKKDAATDTKKVAVTVAAQDFGESYILGEIYAQGLAAKGFSASVKKLGANAYRPIELEAFKSKTINFAPEYAASMLEGLNNKKGEATGDVVATAKTLETYLTPLGLTALTASEAVDTNAFVVTKATADKYKLKTLSDLAAYGKDLKIGAPADCETNPFCMPGLKKTYGLDLAKGYTALGADQVASALDADSVQIGLLFSTDSRIATKGYVLLEDDKHMLAADNVLPVVSTELGDNADLIAASNAITAKLTTAKLIEMNKAYDVDKEDAAVIAKGFLTDEGLI